MEEIEEFDEVDEFIEYDCCENCQYMGWRGGNPYCFFHEEYVSPEENICNYYYSDNDAPNGYVSFGVRIKDFIGWLLALFVVFAATYVFVFM